MCLTNLDRTILATFGIQKLFRHNFTAGIYMFMQCIKRPEFKLLDSYTLWSKL